MKFGFSWIVGVGLVLGSLSSCSKSEPSQKRPLKEARELIDEGRPDAAISILLGKVDQYRELPSFWSSLSRAYDCMNPPELEKALGAIREAKRLSPTDAYYYYAESTILAEMDLPDAALPSALKACEYEPDKGSYRWNVGRIREDLGDYEAARIDFQSALDRDGSDEWLWISLARVCEKSGKPDEGRKNLEEALDRWPENSRIRVEYAALLDRIGETDSAVSEFLKVVRQSPEDERAAEQLFRIVDKNYPTLQALEVFTNAVDESPENPSLVRYLGLTFRKGDHWKEAEICLRKAIDLGCKDQEVWDELLMCIAGQGEMKRMRETIDEGLKVNETNPHIWQTLAYFELVHGNYEAVFEAADNYVKNTESRIGIQSFWSKLFRQFEKIGKPQWAAKVLEKAKEGGITESQIRSNLKGEEKG